MFTADERRALVDLFNAARILSARGELRAIGDAWPPLDAAKLSESLRTIATRIDRLVVAAVERTINP